MSKTTEEELQEFRAKEGVNIVEALIGKTFDEVRQVSTIDGDELQFISKKGQSFKFYHRQDCCEDVSINDICGQLSDLVDSPITLAEEAWREASSDEVSEEGTWTFYKFATINGHVTVRWIGESNGYYSESVDFGKMS